jgi:hypothetical protein
MAKSKSKGKSVEPKKNKVVKSLTADELFKADTENMRIPFDLFGGLTMVTDELKDNEFVYDHFTNSGKQDIITFTRNEGKEVILINIEKENLIVRHFDILEEGRRKARVLYVVKPTERTFELVKSRT